MFQDGADASASAPPVSLLCRSSRSASHPSLAVLVPYRSPAVFSLRWPQPPLRAALPNSTTRPHAPQRDSHPLRCPRPGSLRLALQRAPRLPPGLLPFRSPLLGKSSLVSSPPSSDMLKSKGSSCAPRPRTPALARARRAAYRVRPRSSSPRGPRDPLAGRVRLRVFTASRRALILRQIHLPQPCYDLYPI